MNVLTQLRDHGIAVHSGACLSLKPWRDPLTGRDYVYAGIISTSSLVVQIDVASGRSRFFPLPAPCEGPWGMAFTLEGHVLVTSCSGHLCRINPATGKVWITADTQRWLWGIDRGADGKFYLGSSSDCRLFRYDAATEQLEDLGRLAAKQTYLRSVAGGADGYVYGSVGCTAAQIVAYHIATRRVTTLLPKAEAQPDFQQLFYGRNGQLYTHTVNGNVYRLAHGAAFRVNQKVPPRPVTLPDGRTLTALDPDAIRVGTKIISYKYKTTGANIFHLAEGPRQTVYASTIMPLYLARYTPATRKLENLGRGAPDNGEAYSFGHCDGKLYYGCYSLGSLMTYDPAQPLHNDLPGALRWRTNPRFITNLGTGHNRPRAMCVDSRKRVWIGSVPEYGRRHGGLGCYDSVRRRYTNQPVVIRDQSIIALAADATGDVLYGGTSILRGSGTEPVTNTAHLFAWETRRQKLLWKQTPIPKMANLNNLLYRAGKLYGTAAGAHRFNFFCFDPQRQKMEYVIPSQISGTREQSMCFGPDGNIYGITWMVLFRWRPATGQIEELYRCAGDAAKQFVGGSLFHRGAIIIDGRYYFSCGPKIMSLPLP